jgi:hypothetical protein
MHLKGMYINSAKQKQKQKQKTNKEAFNWYLQRKSSSLLPIFL